MTKKERVMYAIKGLEPDAVPVSFSIHFPREKRNGEDMVKEHLRFFRETDTDILKLMNENLVPDMGPIQTPEDWKQVRCMTMEDEFMRDQMELTKRVLDKSDPDAFRIGTLHGICASTIHPIEHRYGYTEVRQMLCSHLRQNKAPVLDAMKKVAEVQCNLARAYVEAGMDGVYYASLGGEKRFFTDEEFAEYIEPFDKQIMTEIRAAGGIVILHICKDGLNMKRYESYGPYADVVNWGVYEGPYSLEKGKALFKNCAVLGGLAHDRNSVVYKGTQEEIWKAVKKMIEENGKKKFLIGADCTMPGDISYEKLRMVAEAARDVSGN